MLLIFSLELQICGVTVQLLSENDFEAVLVTFCCYDDYGSNVSGGSSEDRYRSKRLSQMLLVHYGLLNSQNISINNSEKDWLLTCQDTSGVAKKAAEVAEKKEQ